LKVPAGDVSLLSASLQHQQTLFAAAETVRVLKVDARFHLNSSQLGESLGASKGIDTSKIATAEATDL
jgi:hypothetical protein